MTPMRMNFPYLMCDRDRHGVTRYYLRRHGRKVRIREKPGTEAFAQAYADALRALDPKAADDRNALKHASAGTLGWLAASYFSSVEFRRLDPKSMRTRRAIIEECLREPRKPGAEDLMRDCPINVLSAAHIKMLRDRKADTPGAANNRRKWLSAMFSWSVENGLMRMNPAREIRRIRYASDGFHPWTVDEVCQFEERHPIGTKARLRARASPLSRRPSRRRRDFRSPARQGWLVAHGAPKNTLQAPDGIREAGTARPRRHYHAEPDRQPHLLGDGVRQAVYSQRVRQLVS